MNFLGEIPLVQSIREGGDSGMPVMMSDDAISKAAFHQFADNAVRTISTNNAMEKPEKFAEAMA